MMKIDSVIPANYTFSITANEGENQLVIMYSASQALAGPLMVVAISVDGGMDVIADYSADDKWVKFSDFRPVVLSAINAWTKTGTGMTDEEYLDIVKKVFENYGFSYDEVEDAT